MTDPVLVLNCGSSSIKYRLIDLPDGAVRAKGLVERIGEPGGEFVHAGPKGERHRVILVADHAEGLALIVDAFGTEGPDLSEVGLSAIGHRVVHGGTRFSEPVRITDEVVGTIEELSRLAPLHNPANLAGIDVARRMFPELPHVAVFDTAFHSTLPEVAYNYAVPSRWRDRYQVRRYGFHGTSHAYVSRRAASLLGAEPSDVNVIVLHLGNGASAAAVRGGESVDTSMGLTPLEGLVMGTRSGDLDPAVIFHLHRAIGLDYDAIDDALNRHSGLAGLAGVNDMREVLSRADDGDSAARTARDTYCYRIRKYVGAYAAVLGRVDAIVFTAGVGEHSPDIRARSLSGLESWGISVDPERNAVGATRISPPDAPVAVLVVPTDEELEIATQTLRVAGAASNG